MLSQLDEHLVGTARCAVTARVERAEHARYNVRRRSSRRCTAQRAVLHHHGAATTECYRIFASVR